MFTYKAFLETAVLRSQISEQQKKELDPVKPKPGVFDGLPKTHKAGCPIRPIVSQVNTVTRKLSEYVDKVLQPYVTKMETYNKDTIDMINTIEGVNSNNELSKHATVLLLTMDIDSFYTNVTCEMAVKSITDILKQNNHTHSEITFIADCLKLIFESNNFTFNGHHYIQICGMSMGSPCAPSVCSLTFYVYEIKFIEQHPKFLKWKRHIDDIFAIFAGTERQLQILINKFIKKSDFGFTSEISEKSVNFLDITISLEKDKTLSTSVYRHPAKVPVYTHKQSCQSENVKSSIIKSSCLRFRRICSSLKNYDRACKELQNNLIYRGHQLQQVQRTIKDVRKMDREALLRRKSKDSSTTAYCPRLLLTFIPGVTRIISDIMKRLWHCVSDLFPFHLSMSYRNSCKIEDILTKKVNYPACRNYKIHETGINVTKFNINEVDSINIKCDRRSCKSCDEHFVIPDSENTKTSIEVLDISLPNKYLNCESANLIYLVSCNICNSMFYVGETGQQLRDRMYGHRTKSAVLYKHFSSANHTLMNMKVVVLHKLKNNTWWLYRKGIEYFYLKMLKPKLNIDFAPP